MNPTTQNIWEAFHHHLKTFILSRIPNSSDGDDLLQEVFFKIHKNIGRLKDREKLRAWVFRIAHNTINDYFRNQSRTNRAREIPDPPLKEEDFNHLNQKIASCLKPMADQLPETYRQAVLLAELEGWTQKQVAQELNLSISGAKSRIQRGREKLKEMLLHCCHLELDRIGNIIDMQSKSGDCKWCG